jgi:glycosyltransferase involved in cell wall biosynthesis
MSYLYSQMMVSRPYATLNLASLLKRSPLEGDEVAGEGLLEPSEELLARSGIEVAGPLEWSLVVRATGGLADTIVDMENGFSFERYDRQQLHETLLRACDVYLHDPTTWQRLVETGMKQDWSWDSSARQYIQLYQQTIERMRAGGLSL